MTPAAAQRRPSLTLLVAIMAGGHVAMSMMLPAVPDIARAYGTDAAAVQVTFTAYLISYALVQLPSGPMSDAFGRRPLLVGGMSLFLAGSLGCLLAPDVETLMVARIAQGAGACTGIVVVRALVRDVYETSETARVLSILTATIGLAPAIAPLIGGVLVVHLGWQSIFWLTVLYAAGIVLCTVLFLPETRTPGAVTRHGFAQLMQGILWLLRSRAFLAYTGVTPAASAAFYAYLAATPLVLIELMGVSPDGYGLLALIFPLSFTVGGTFSARTTRRIGMDRMILAGCLLFLAASLVMVALPLAGVVSVAATMAPIFFIGLAHGILVPNAMAGSVSIRPELAGSAAALGGFAHSAAGAVATAIAVLFVYDSQLPMAAIIAVCAVLAVGCALMLPRRPRKPS